MHPHVPRADRHRDGGHRPLHCPPQTTPGSVLWVAQPRPCRCRGNRWPRDDGRPVAPHPVEVAAADTPPAPRLHVRRGTARPHGGGSARCRTPHALLRPRRPSTTAPTGCRCPGYPAPSPCARPAQRRGMSKPSRPA
ncbi:DUF6083 domain-containing protein [Streptomyces sp. NPDC005004]